MCFVLHLFKFEKPQKCMHALTVLSVQKGGLVGVTTFLGQPEMGMCALVSRLIEPTVRSHDLEKLIVNKILCLYFRR